MKYLARICFAASLLASPSSAFALGMETFGNAPVGAQTEWAKGVVDVANLPSRVYSRWVNGNETFYFQGRAESLNEALRKFAGVKAEVRHVNLLPGTGRTQSFQGIPIDYDWELHVPSGLYRARAIKKHAEMTVYISAKKPRPIERKPVERWLADLGNDSYRTRETARTELAKLGNDAKPFLRETLKGRQTLETRRRIEELLARLPGYDVTDLEIPKGLTIISIDELLKTGLKDLKSNDYTTSGLAVLELSRFVDYDETIVPTLVEMLKKDKHEWVRRVAAGSLSHAGAKAALPVLKDGMKDTDKNIRDTFEVAIAKLESVKDEPGRTDKVARKRAIASEIGAFSKTLR